MICSTSKIIRIFRVRIFPPLGPPAPEVRVEGEVTEAWVEGLTPAAHYLLTLHAHNAMGASQPSEVRGLLISF